MRAFQLSSSEVGVIGAKANKFNLYFAPDTECDHTLSCYVVVNAAAFAYGASKGMPEVKVGPFRAMVVPGPGPNGSEGCTMLLADPSLGLETGDMLPAQVASVIDRMVTFRSFHEAAISCNLLVYALNSPVLSKYFQKWYDYDFVLERLACETTNGKTILTTPSQFLEVISELYFVRHKESKSMDLFDLRGDFIERELTCPVVKDYKEKLRLPTGFREVKDEPLFQSQVEPNPKLVREYDPSIS